MRLCIAFNVRSRARGAGGRRERGGDGETHHLATGDHQSSASTTILSFSANLCFSDFFGLTLTP